MTDSTLPTIGPAITKFKSVVFTAIGSGIAGDQVGNQLAEPIANILTFFIQLMMTTPMPPAITADFKSVFHTLILALCLGGALGVHYQVVKPKDQA